MNPLSQFLSQITKGFGSLPPARKLTILVAAAVTLLSIGLVVFLTNQAEYRVLFSNLTSEDAGTIVAKLNEKKIPYKLSPAGDIISVPSEKVSEMRLDLAASGLPKGGGVGFEIFDTKNLGVTEFVQQLNYQRALQGELSRTISSLDEIQSSRVHIVIPKKSLFAEDQKKPTASVILKLKSGRTLQEPQIQGIAHLVASSIEGLNPQDVMIVDGSGKVLSKVTDQSDLSKMSNTQSDYKRNIEKDLASRIQTMLEKVVGEGKAVVRLNTDLDFRVMEKTEEIFDSEEPVVRSMQRATEKATTPASSFGGESTVIPPTKPGAAFARNQSSREKSDETINYEISKTVNKTVMPVGDIKKLSIAVLVDGLYTKNDKGVEEYQARSDKEMASLDDLVKKAAGFDAKRGDQVIVTNVPFKKVDADTAGFAEKSWVDQFVVFMPIIRQVVLVAVILLIVFFVARPVVKMLIAKGQEQGVSVHAYPSGAARELGGRPSPASLSPGEERGLTEADVVRQMAGSDARKFAELLRTWIK
ncbi:MAG: flagellar basal-body MS-ring/collar protein FliF [Deltaproteobacteria bacterium]|nr:flagellar basal-body MS-ring/collar protein FliF [Deltaproteobacteria bacterium]